MRAELVRPVDVDTALPRTDARRVAVDDLASRCARRAYRVAYDLLGSPADAEDAVQEALARACDRVANVRDPATIDAWFFRILTNLCLKTLRRRRVGRALARLWPADRGQGDATPDRAPLADASLENARMSARLVAAVETLPPKQKAAVVLHYGHELSVDDTAAMLGVGAGTAKTHLVRGLKKLRAALQEDPQ